MKHVSILVPKGNSSVSNIEGAYKLFTGVNDILHNNKKPRLFKVQLVASEKELTPNNSLFNAIADVTIRDVNKTDLIIIPALQDDLRSAVALNQHFVPWILKQYAKGAEVASLCVGAFLLASTGLLNGKKCTTHWTARNDFKKMFPNVKLMPDKIITEENGLYTSAGAYSFLNLLLYLVEKYAGRDMAIHSAKLFEIEIDRNNQSQFMIFSGQKEHGDEPVIQAQRFIENNFREKITVDKLATMFALSRRNLERRFKKATTNSVVEYIQRVKIEAAKINLESSRENVTEVMYNVGYSDPKTFRIIFKKYTGLSPVQYRNKYYRSAS
jgi:transcriptional regulator GlxA family with amidase domain